VSESSAHTSPVEIVGSFLVSAPVDVTGIAEALGVAVEFSYDLDEGIAGSIERTSSNRFLIKVNADHSETRKRFTLAHEIAHYILHRDLIGDGITDDAMYRSGQPSHVETEANQYAAGILMPAQLIKDQWRRGVKSYVEMANKFGVSSKAAEIRMKELRLN
jgi:Zn-dependent peptidase ImmA (M78 family)